MVKVALRICTTNGAKFFLTRYWKNDLDKDSLRADARPTVRVFGNPIVWVRRHDWLAMPAVADWPVLYGSVPAWPVTDHCQQQYPGAGQASQRRVPTWPIV